MVPNLASIVEPDIDGEAIIINPADIAENRIRPEPVDHIIGNGDRVAELAAGGDLKAQARHIDAKGLALIELDPEYRRRDLAADLGFDPPQD